MTRKLWRWSFVFAFMCVPCWGDGFADDAMDEPESEFNQQVQAAKSEAKKLCIFCEKSSENLEKVPRIWEVEGPGDPR